MRKKLLFTLATIALTVSMAIPVFAAWKQSNKGWWYENSNGSYPTNAWQEIGGKWYYFDGSGYMVSNKWVGNYYLGADGVMLKNTTTPDGYKVGADGAWVQELKEHTAVVSIIDKYDLSKFQFDFSEPLSIADKGNYYEIGAILSKEILVSASQIEGKREGDKIKADDGKTYKITDITNHRDYYYYSVDNDNYLCFSRYVDSDYYILRGASDIPERTTAYSGKVRILKSASVTLNVGDTPYNYKTITAPDFLGSLTENPFAGVTEVFATFNDDGYITEIKRYWQS